MERTKLIIQGIKCDSCTWKDMSVPYDKYPEYVNRACPCCGENLLTEQDYLTTRTIVAFTKAVDEIFKDVPDTGDRKAIKINMDGTGTFSAEDVDPEEIEEELAGYGVNINNF